LAKTSLIVKAQRKKKFSSREYNRCPICGRPRAYLRKFGICRICFRGWLFAERSRASSNPAGNRLQEFKEFCA